jgi:hypothetical protein
MTEEGNSETSEGIIPGYERMFAILPQMVELRAQAGRALLQIEALARLHPERLRLLSGLGKLRTRGGYAWSE